MSEILSLAELLGLIVFGIVVFLFGIAIWIRMITKEINELYRKNNDVR